MLEKMGVRLPADSPLRWRSLVAAIRQELDDEPMDAVFLFERLVQLFATMPGGLRKALFGSPLFLHRFAVAFEGLDAELFKLESDELCHAEGIYELCLLIRDNMESTFLATFAKIFDQDEPKRMAVGSESVGDSSQATETPRQGPEAASSTGLQLPGTGFGPRASRFPVSVGFLCFSFCWSIEISTNTLPPCVLWLQVNGESSDSARSDAGEAAPASSRPPRIETGARAARQESRRSTRPDSGTDPNVAAEPDSTGARRAGKRKRRTLWSQEEVAALQDGFKLFGSYPNVWVLTKAKYAHVLRNRSNVDLKDKYRNLLKYGKIPPPAEGDGAA
ncbi:hypothetical protein BBJ28_00005696 [Nothophytophthora sp. Chile5]|nr:hypothetical protein BBJ28_00005696 [Nothophytophthora sp. Chile5]